MMSNPIYMTPPHFKVIDIAATTDLVAAIAGRKIRILSLFIVAAGAVTATFKSNTTNITGAMSMITGVPFSMPYNPVGWGETASGEKLNLTLSGATQVSGWMTYELVDAELQP